MPKTPVTLFNLLELIVKEDPYLSPYKEIIKRRILRLQNKTKELILQDGSLKDFASGYKYFGLHLIDNEWVFREWAPNANKIYIIGDVTDWQPKNNFLLKRIDNNGVWEIRLPEKTFKHGDLYRLLICWDGGEGDRIPSYASRVVQDSETLIFSAQVYKPDIPFQWKISEFKNSSAPPLIYEAHIGMAQEEERVGSYIEFKEKILPRIIKSGYNILQLMAIQEHPYYASFGYHVSNFFAASSRFGTPDELKELIDAAHQAGLAVIMDIVHSHAVNNQVEGLSNFDGTLYQYFHDGPMGIHSAWDSRCFDYGKNSVIHFLLSNCRFWLEEYKLDGFRFDGITSMLYFHHGLEKAFTSYEDYFDQSVDEDALIYLALANMLIHDVKPDAFTIAEDISGMPGLATPVCKGGTGFDFRLAMGVPDYWIKLVKEIRDEDWPIDHIWYELNNRRVNEKTISYVESHDQALVGDKTLIFRLIDSEIYNSMNISTDSIRVDRGMALHKIIRLITLATAGNGYLNFMGNEFGHPEWIDFPRQGNGWSYHYARRQWHLVDSHELKYRFLACFDQDIITLVKQYHIFDTAWPELLYEHCDNKVIAFFRGRLLFVFNFHHTDSYTNYKFVAPGGRYSMIIDSDQLKYGGHNRLCEGYIHYTDLLADNNNYISLYLPARTALVLHRDS